MDKKTRGLILLNMLQDIGYIRLNALLKAFETIEAIFDAPQKELIKIKGIGKTIAEAIKNAGSRYDIDNEISLIEKNNIRVVTVFDEDYPENLKQIYDPPIVLYIKGRLDKRDNLAIAIVGSRRCSYYGIRTAEGIAGDLSSKGITIISGMARGIDTAAHKGALKAKGRTIAVLGNGLASVYPVENKRLAQEISENGALLSEFCMEMPPHKNNFPQRNRVISGLSKGVVVVEAALKSGALITADFALEQGREVFAVPGAAGLVTSAGTNNLIKEGARLAEGAEDILQELGYSGISDKESNSYASKKQFDNDCENNIYHILSDEPCCIDDIRERLAIESKEVTVALLNLQMKGFVKQLPGKLYVKAR